MMVSFAGLLLQSCTSTNREQDVDAFSKDHAEQMFEAAYSNVQARYIEAVGVDTLALAGFDGLHSIDPRLTVIADASSVSFYNGKRELERLARPAPQDSSGWAALTAQVLDRSVASSSTAGIASTEELYSALMNGIVDKLDRYSRYESARDAGSQRAVRDGFGGVGVTIRATGEETRVMEVLPGSPAADAGVEQDDVITQADGHPLTGLLPEDVIERLRGPIGSIVVLDLLRGSSSTENIRVAIRRAHIVPPSVVGKLRDGVAVLRIRGFNRYTASDFEEELEHLEDLANGRLSGIVLDLRNNPGGLLDQAVEMADLLLDNGPMIFTRGRHPAANSAFTADSHELAEGVPVVILINGYSASASEMLAAALQARGRAVLIGSTTHGKGSVQNLQRMPNGGELLITWSRMYTPTGYVLDGLGVLPNICTSKDGMENQSAGLALDPARLGRQFRDWYRYDHVDIGLAETLRRACPASMEAPESDLTLALELLRNGAAYKSALAPSVKAFSHRTLQTPLQGRS